MSALFIHKAVFTVSVTTIGTYFQIDQINASLEARYGVGCRGVHYWKHRNGFWRGNHPLFAHDGVHLNIRGIHRYWHSVQAAVGKGVLFLFLNII